MRESTAISIVAATCGKKIGEKMAALGLNPCDDRNVAKVREEQRRISELRQERSRRQYPADPLKSANVTLRWRLNRKREQMAAQRAAAAQAERRKAWRSIQAQLRSAGFVRECTSRSRSNYYTRGDVTVRLSDHEIPWTPERQHNLEHGHGYFGRCKEFILDRWSDPSDVLAAAAEFLSALDASEVAA